MLFQATPRTLPRLLLLFGLLSLLSACSSWSDGFSDPKVHLVKVEVIRAKLLEQEFELFFRVENPNSFNLSVSNLDYRVFLNEVKLAEGQSHASFTVPAHGQTVFRVPVRANLWRHLKRVVRMLKNPDQPISYRLEGEIQVGSFFGRSVHLSRNGEIIPGNYIPE